MLSVLFFIFELAFKNWALNMHFNPKTNLKGLFLGGGRQTPPGLYIDLDPPAFIGLKESIGRMSQEKKPGIPQK